MRARLIKTISLIIGVNFGPTTIMAQLPISNFIVKTTACVGEELNISNNSTDASQYTWDFCEGDLFLDPTVTSIGVLSGSFNPEDIDIKKSNGFWYGFVTSRSTNTLFRISFGSTLKNNSPEIISLGNPGSLLSSPGPIKLINENGNWFALVVNYGSTTIIRISFGSDLGNNTPLADLAFNGLDIGSKGFDMTFSLGRFVGVVANTLTNKLSIINFGNSVQNNPAISDVLTTNPITGAAGLDDITLFPIGSSWYGFVVAFNSYTVYRVDFGNDLFNIPTTTEISGVSFQANERPSGIQLKQDVGSFVGFISTFTGAIYRLNFGSDVTNTSPLVYKIPTLQIPNSVNFKLVNDNSVWSGFSIDVTDITLNRVVFPNTCSASQATSTKQIPTSISYNQPGTYNISLTVASQNEYPSYSFQSISILNKQSPDIALTVENVCAGNTVFFKPINFSGDISIYSWNFDDGNISSLDNPSHLYSSALTYYPSLTVTSTNGCQNFRQDTIKIYNPPVSSFTLPSGLICTNNSFTFINNTIDNFEGFLTTEWFVNDQPVSSERDLQFIFITTGDQQIKLVSSIPGCANELIQVLNNVQSGPVVDFDYLGMCANENVSFINKSSGSISGYEWDLGNGTIVSDVNPTETYSTYGVYSITLDTYGTNGCISTMQKNISIYSTPQPNLFIDTPPFSCAQTPTQFHDNTAAMPDGNIASWSWKFNDGSGETSNIQNPTHTFLTAGDYNIDLEVETNYGCKSSVTLPVTISSSPTADFSTGSICLNKPVTFTNNSSVGILSSNWIINGNPYLSLSPSLTFSGVGKYSASLTVKGSNLCENTIIKEIEVKPIPVLNFNTTAICAGQVTTLTDQSTGVDLPVSWSWNFGNGNIAPGSPVTYSFPSVGVFPVEMSVSTLAGCAYSFTKNIAVATPPIALFTATPTFGPPPLVVQFTSTSSNASSLLWKFNNNAGATSSVPNPLFNFNELGEYAVELTAYNSVGCSSTYSKIISVLIPNIDLTLDNLQIKHNADNSFSPILTISNKSNVPISNAAVLLNGSGGIRLSQVIQMNLTAGDVGEFTLPFELRSNDDYLCAEVQVIGDANSLNNTQCLNLTDQLIIVQPYPNPSDGKVFFEAVLAEEGSGSLTILNMNGKVIFMNDFDNLLTGMNQIQLDLSGNPPGLYLAIWEVNGQRTSHKFLLQ